MDRPQTEPPREQAWPERVFLVGFMGAGKTTVGQALAQRLGFAFVDTDEEVVALEGRSIDELFREHGEGYFREREWEVLLALAERRRTVVATGGGLFLASAHREFIRRHGMSVWLEAPLEEIWARCRPGEGRPLFTTREELADLLEARRDRYALADHRVLAGGRSVEEIVAEILARLSGGPAHAHPPGEDQG